MDSFKIGNTWVGRNKPCYLIAEIGNNHQGDLSLALQMIRQASEAGASAVKFQKRDLDNLYTKAFLDAPYTGRNSFGNTYGEHRRHLELSAEDFIKCKELAEDCGVEFLITPFDFPSVDFCQSLGLVAYKVASGDLTNTPLIRYIAQHGKPVIISTGASALEELEAFGDGLGELDCPIALLYAVSSYPTAPNQVNLARLAKLKQLFPNTVIGYSGHELGIETAIYARVMGASIIEKHFTLDKNNKGTDNAFSLLPEELQLLHSRLQQVDEVLGQGEIGEINAYEAKARYKMGKGVYAMEAVPEGTVLTLEHLVLKSPGNSLTPADLHSVIGRRTKRALQAEEDIRLNLLEDV